MQSRRDFASLVLASAGPADRARNLQARFIAPCCWNESVSVHRSETAAQMRAEIAGMVDSGKSDDEIVAFFVAGYGERILLEPTGLKFTGLMTIPVVALAVGSVFVTRFMKRKRLATAPETAAPAAVTVPDEDLEW